jgi:hypothetical protein
VLTGAYGVAILAVEGMGMTNATIYYVTEATKQGHPKRIYRTRALTQSHHNYHDWASKHGWSCTTMMCDTSVKWPFGVFAEVVRRTTPREAQERLLASYEVR